MSGGGQMSESGTQETVGPARRMVRSTEVLRTRNDCAEFVSPCTFSLMSAETLSHGGNR